MVWCWSRRQKDANILWYHILVSYYCITNYPKMYWLIPWFLWVRKSEAACLGDSGLRVSCSHGAEAAVLWRLRRVRDLLPRQPAPVWANWHRCRSEDTVLHHVHVTTGLTGCPYDIHGNWPSQNEVMQNREKGKSWDLLWPGFRNSHWSFPQCSTDDGVISIRCQRWRHRAVSGRKPDTWVAQWAKLELSLFLSNKINK